MLTTKISGIMFVILSLTFAPLYAQDANAQPQDTTPEMQSPGWLGVWVQPIPRALKAQLAHLIKSGEGLMVTRVENGSPAQQAGMQRYDVLLTLDGQKLYTPEQLARLVQHEKANNEIELDIIRQAQLMTLQTTLSSKGKRTLAQTRRYPPPFPPMPGHLYPPLQRPQMTAPFDNDISAWDQFESVEVKTLPDGRYHAAVSFKDRDNETRSFTFEGKKQEIIQQIKQLEALPQDKKHALLKALKFKPYNMNRFEQNDFARDLLDSPLWSRNPFDHPFFRDPYFMNRFNSDPWWGYRQPWQLHLYPDRPPGKYRHGWNRQR